MMIAKYEEIIMIARGRSRTRSINRGLVEEYAAKLRAYILENDIKNFEEMIHLMNNEGGIELLNAVINHNFLDEPNNRFTAMQAATVTTIATGETDIFTRLIELGAETAWDISHYSFARASDFGSMSPERTILNDCRYHGNSISGGSVYQSFESAFLDQNLEKGMDRSFLNASAEILSEQIEETLGIYIPANITALIREYTGREMSDVHLLNRNVVGWMRNLHDQAIFESFSAQYRQKHPDCDEQGYGPGALVVYQPKNP